MKNAKLEIESTYRDFLSARGKLDFDENGNERLIGLSHGESILYLELGGMALQSSILADVASMNHYLEMYDRHTSASPATSLYRLPEGLRNEFRRRRGQ